MDKIVFDFNGTLVELESSLSLLMMIASDSAKFSYGSEKYVIEEKTVIGIEQSAENLKRKKELLKDTNYKGDLPDDVINCMVKMKKA